MSSTGVTIGYGTQIRIGRGEIPTWTTMAGVKDVNFPSSVADEHEVTNQASPYRTKEFIPGLIDYGEVSVPLDWVPGSDQDILLAELRATGELVQIEFKAPNGGDAEVYAGFVKGYERVSPVNAPMSSTVIFRLSGRILP